MSIRRTNINPRFNRFICQPNGWKIKIPFRGRFIICPYLGWSMGGNPVKPFPFGLNDFVIQKLTGKRYVKR